MSALVLVSIKHVSVTFYLRARLNMAQYGHPDNTDTLACPLGVRINGVPLYMHDTQSTKDLDMLTTRVWNYQNMAMCSYIYCGTFQYCQIHFCNDCICMFCETWIEFAFLRETWFSLCIFAWNVIAYFFLWTRSCFLNFLWCMRRPITFAWNCFQKRYRGPSSFKPGFTGNRRSVIFRVVAVLTT